MTIRVRVPQKEGYEVLPRGSYELEIVGAEETVSQRSNTPQIALDLRVASGEYENRTLKHWVPLTEKSGFRLQALLEACDPEQEIHTNVPTTDVDEKGNEINDIELDSVVDLVSRYFIGDIVERKNPETGDPQNDIRKMYALPIEEGAPSDAKGKAQADASADVPSTEKSNQSTARRVARRTARSR